MKIGILTFAKIANFGANLQAFSTYSYLEKLGYNPIIINWQPNDFIETTKKYDEQYREHIQFVDKYMKQTNLCFTENDINNEIKRCEIKAVIIGSDAVLQTFPFLARLRISKRIFTIEKITSERLFPNAFWGTWNTNGKIPVALMSASCQNTQFYYLPWHIKRKMYELIKQFSYISVRDSWTFSMIKQITNNNILPPITPDPVFAFNQNIKDLIPTKDFICKQYNLSENYLLFSFKDPSIISMKWLSQFKESTKHECVALPMPNGIKFDHPNFKEITIPLSPLHWYALIKYSQGYIGQNMHPIIVALHNSVPFYCFDSYGIKKISRTFVINKTSKIYHILKEFDFLNNRCASSLRFSRQPSINTVLNAINSFDKEKCKITSEQKYKEYIHMMQNIISSFKFNK